MHERGHGSPDASAEREIPGLGRMSPSEFGQVSRNSVNVLRELGTDIQWVHSSAGDGG